MRTDHNGVLAGIKGLSRDKSPQLTSPATYSPAPLPPDTGDFYLWQGGQKLSPFTAPTQKSQEEEIVSLLVGCHCTVQDSKCCGFLHTHTYTQIVKILHWDANNTLTQKGTEGVWPSEHAWGWGVHHTRYLPCWGVTFGLTCPLPTRQEVTSDCGLP